MRRGDGHRDRVYRGPIELAVRFGDIIHGGGKVSRAGGREPGAGYCSRPPT
jgi:hypothetical protein